MATTTTNTTTAVQASCVVPLETGFVWNKLRDFTFPQSLLRADLKVEIISGTNTTIGSIRKVTWKSGQTQQHKLLEINDQLFVLRWELVCSEPEEEVTTIVSCIECIPSTVDNHTMIRWSVTTTGASEEFIAFQKKALRTNVVELKFALIGSKVPSLYHAPEGPSTRVIWMAEEIGLPIEVITCDIVPETALDGRERLTESRGEGAGTEYYLLNPTGKLVARFIDKDVELIESGAIVWYLLDKYDLHNQFRPVESDASARARFLQWFFLSAATLDTLLLKAYIHMFVMDAAEADEALVETTQKKWIDLACERLDPILKDNDYIFGNKFSGADVMLGFTVNLANTLGWLLNGSPTHRYLQRLSKREAFQKAFSPDEQE